MATPQRQERRQSAVVFNPIKVTEAKLRESVNAAAEAAGWAPPIWFPTTEEDPGQRVTASALRRGAEVVIVAGGDGTVRAVASALRDADAAMAILPTGTGNLLARNLSLPINSMDACIELAFSGVNHDIDLGLAAIERENGDKEEHAFLVMTGLGIDAKMVANTNTELKKAVGWIAYIDGTIRSIPQLKPIRLRFRLDGAPERGMSAHSIIIGNCGTLPGGIPLLPDALPDDGILDIVALRPRGMFGWIRVWNTLTFDNGVLRKTRVGRKILDLKSDVKDVTYMRAKELTIRVEEPQSFQLDGDEFGTVRSVRAYVHAGALKVRFPAS